jgi:hypothetical protein
LLLGTQKLKELRWLKAAVGIMDTPNCIARRTRPSRLLMYMVHSFLWFRKVTSMAPPGQTVGE